MVYVKGRSADTCFRERYLLLTKKKIFVKICNAVYEFIKHGLHTVNISYKKRSRYRPGVAQRVGRGIALLFQDCGTRRGWVVSSTPRPHFTPGKEPVPILQEAGWAPGPVWTGAENFVPTGIRSRTVQSVVNRYTDWATRPTNISYTRAYYQTTFSSKAL